MTPLARFAPTPSGYLHLGNAVNALLCSWLAREHGAELALRIDDLDRDRVRPEYEDDIARVLAWLGIQTLPPSRQSADEGRYLAARERLERSDAVVFACACSRASRAARPCPCERLDLALAVDETALVWRRGTDDVVVWRRDGIPAYHLASVVDDDALGITHVVRGEDLADATVLQRELAVLAGVPAFSHADVRHHGLVTGPGGAKLSKSQLRAGPLPSDDATLASVHARARALAPAAGIAAP